MENAIRALFMAAAVLVGVLLLSLGAYLFSIFGDYGNQISGRIEQKQIDEFNSQFCKYENSSQVRIHDIISVSNLAKQYNSDNEFDITSNYYIKVTINGLRAEGQNVEAMSDTKKNELINKYSLKSDNITPQYFKCTSVTIDETSKIVNSITFQII